MEKLNEIEMLVLNSANNVVADGDLDVSLNVADKDLVIKEVESIKDLKKNKLDTKFKPNFSDLIETGQITENLYLLFDYNRGKYLLINKSTGNRAKPMDQSKATHKIFELFMKAGIELKNPSSDLKYVKKVYVVFDIQKDSEWEEDMGDFLNEFNESKTMLAVIKNKRLLKTTRYKEINLLKFGAPHIWALLMNLFEEDENAVRHFVNYLSTFVNTRKKIPTCFMFAGIEGSGKGVLYKLLKKIFGEDYSTEQLASSLKSDFNDGFENKLLVNLNEVSTDFSKTDTATQKLKSLITDDTFFLNCKGVGAFDAKNYFFILLSTNSKNSLKISMTDRRYNYFVQERTLKDVAEKDFKTNIKDFSEKLVFDDLDYFVDYLACFNYDAHLAQTIFQTDSKKRAQLATSNAFDIMLKFLKDKDLDSIDREINDMSAAYDDTEDKSKYSDNYRTAIHNAKFHLIENIESEFKKDFISNASLTSLYDVLVEDTKKKEDRVLNKIFESNFGKSLVKNIEGTNKRGRSLLSDKDLKELNKIHVEGDPIF